MEVGISNLDSRKVFDSDLEKWIKEKILECDELILIMDAKKDWVPESQIRQMSD